VSARAATHSTRKLAQGKLPLESGWLEYRADAIPTGASSTLVRTARLAYYASASHTMMLLAESGGGPALVELLIAELDAFLDDVQEGRA
jgi:hypothetical protein